jgi:mannitol/fructose-specific phosphotransferase system IIA component (Ntr-type)
VASAFPDLAPFVHPQRVLFLDGMPSKREALLRMVEVMAQVPDVGSTGAFMQAIFDREDVTSTGIGGGVAVPHAQLASITNFVIGIALCRMGIEFAAKDGRPVRVIVMIAAPSNDRPAYLKILASVAARLNRPALVTRMVEAGDSASLLGAFLG